MSDYTTADVERWRDNAIIAAGSHKHTRLCGIGLMKKERCVCGVQDGIDSVEHLASAALEGAKVPGLVEDNAALELLIRRVRDGGYKLVYDDAALLTFLADADAALSTYHPGAALLAEHEAEVSTLQARVTELVADNAALVDVLDEVDHDLGHARPNTPHAQSVVRAALKGDRAGQALLSAHAAQLLDRGRQVSCLQAQIAQLTSERDSARSREADLELVVNHVAGGLGFNAPQGVLGTAKDIVDATKRMVSDRDALQARVVELTRERDEAKELAEDQEALVQAWSDALGLDKGSGYNEAEAIVSERDALRLTVQRLTSREDEIREERDKALDQRDEARRELSALKARVVDLERERDEARRWEKTHRDASQVWEDAAVAVTAERNALQARVKEQEGLAHTLTGAARHAEAANTDLHAALRTAESKRDALRAQVAGLADEARAWVFTPDNEAPEVTITRPLSFWLALSVQPAETKAGERKSCTCRSAATCLVAVGVALGEDWECAHPPAETTAAPDRAAGMFTCKLCRERASTTEAHTCFR